MKNILFIAIVIFLMCTSCSSYSYYYAVMDTNNTNVSKDSTGRFNILQDSLEISYSFAGQNAPLNITVENRSSVPVYINWKESGIILDSATSNTKKAVKVSAVKDSKGAIDFGRFQIDPDATTLVKPYSKVGKQVIQLSNFNYHKVKKNSFSGLYIDKKSNGNQKTYKAVDYVQANSPIQFKTYLTIYPNTPKALNPISVETSFYQSQLINGGKDNPYLMSEYKDRHGNFFYISKENARTAKKIGKGTLGVLGALGTAALWVVDEKMNEENEWR